MDLTKTCFAGFFIFFFLFVCLSFSETALDMFYERDEERYLRIMVQARVIVKWILELDEI